MMGPYVTAALVRDHRSRLLHQADAHRASRLARAAPVPAEPARPSCSSPEAAEHSPVVLRTSGTCPPVVDAEPAA
jgi:hypothetical protein